MKDKEKEFILPAYWHVLVTEDNVEVLSEWRYRKNYPTYKLLVGKITGIANHGEKGHNPRNRVDNFGIEITFDQFRQYVLKKDVDLSNKLEIMTDEELIEEANRRYPRGTEFKSAAKGNEIYISGGNAKSWKSGIFPDGIGNDDLLKEFTHGLLYSNGKWAEIISLPENLELKAYTGKFKVGDKVKVTRIAESREGDWRTSWINTMTLLVGKECIINDISTQSFGYKFIDSNGIPTAFFPEFVLELVESADSLKQSKEFDRNFYVKVNSQEEAKWLGMDKPMLEEMTQPFIDFEMAKLTQKAVKAVSTLEKTLDTVFKRPLTPEQSFKKEPVKLLLFDEDDDNIILFKSTTIKTSNKQLIIND